jgi:bifunctional non-homologous end joining protein LigD
VALSQKARSRQAVALPDFISPELAALVDRPPTGDEWLHEIKYDGYRTGARLEAGKVRMLTRRGLDWTARFRPIAEVLAKLPAKAAYLDGEIAVLGDDGVTSFAALQDALSRRQAERLVYFVFDLLRLDGADLRPFPVVERKQALARLLAKLPKGGPVRYSDHVVGQGPAFFEKACGLKLEGVVSKRADSPYRSERTSAWQKAKCLHRQEFVVGGWMLSEARGRELRSLVVGYYRDGRLIFAGRVGTGFSIKSGRDLAGRLAKLACSDSPFVTVPREYRRGVIWVEPRLVVEVEFTTWTADGILRHPSFRGVREDKPAREVRLESSFSGPSGKANA